jgi:hypothetical protein
MTLTAIAGFQDRARVAYPLAVGLLLRPPLRPREETPLPAGSEQVVHKARRIGRSRVSLLSTQTLEFRDAERSDCVLGPEVSGQDLKRLCHQFGVSRGVMLWATAAE